jgi:hypothetical protein
MNIYIYIYYIVARLYTLLYIYIYNIFYLLLICWRYVYSQGCVFTVTMFDRRTIARLSIQGRSQGCLLPRHTCLLCLCVASLLSAASSRRRCARARQAGRRALAVLRAS